MRYFKIVYQKSEFREVWVETQDETMEELGAKKLFLENFEEYDEESDEHDSYNGSMEILTIDEIDENGDDI